MHVFAQGSTACLLMVRLLAGAVLVAAAACHCKRQAGLVLALACMLVLVLAQALLPP